ncbi:MAG: hypothetical protein QF903_04655, partial [Planctomycetota bacterium]|nr:hypothetical protein [Planctomycetota bacterium]
SVGRRLRAAGTVRVRGSRCAARLELIDPAPERADLHGTLTIPRSWAAVPRTLTLKPAGEGRTPKDVIRLSVADMISEGGGRHRWSAGPQLEGPYQAQVPGTGFGAELEHSRGSFGHDLALPDAAGVTVAVRGVGGDSPPRAVRLRWRRPGEPSASQNVKIDAPRVSFPAPIGPLELELLDLSTGRRVDSRTVVVPAGGLTAAFELAPVCEVTLALCDGAGAVPWDAARFEGRARDLLDGTSVSDRSGRLLLRAGRTYEVRLGGLVDHSALAPLVVDVPVGRRHTHAVRLERLSRR